ncbi:radical SAM protein [Rhodopseudomonas sp. AAP120]|uniref:radical SAM protein n=1 Tax=Rhodopseudomonas sp. AAP120 TaxID=1523430 RepID=UPI0006B9FB22|nr:radical SAM protein [Rhodopseudomonas sp. AAP120]
MTIQLKAITSDVQAAPTPAFPALRGRQPCFSSTFEGDIQPGRLHLPVSPDCNIDCSFCMRDLNCSNQQPGSAYRVLTTDQALGIVERALQHFPTLSVIGIAGPGDPLATNHALDTFAAVRARWPQLSLCLSTNGLMLPERVDQLAELGVETLTVTVNAIEPTIQAQITPKITWQRHRLDGVAAGERLIANQLDGIARAAALGLTIKVNTMLIPTVNEDHIGDVAAEVAAAGAQLITIVPLIPQHRFAHLPSPGLMKRYVARAEAERHLRVFHDCTQCRADACGVRGLSDYVPELDGNALEAEPTFSHG